MCEKGYFNYFRGKNLPHTYNKTHKAAPDCKGTDLQVILPLCFSLGKHRLSGNTHRAPPAREQLLAAGHLNILNFYTVLKQFLRAGRAGGEGLGCSQPCCFGQLMRTGSLALAVQRCCSSTLQAFSFINENNYFFSFFF